MEQILEPIFIRPKQAIAMLGYAKSNFYVDIACGLIPHIRRGRAILIPLKELREWAAKQINQEKES